MGQVKINGIRLNRGYIQAIQEEFDPQDQSHGSLYQFLEFNKINMVFTALNTMTGQSFVLGIIASKYFKQVSQAAGYWKCHKDVTTLSIYPHHYRLHLLGYLFALLGRHQLPFRHMVSSNAMLTFIVDQENCEAFIEMVSSNFDLPLSHVPFEQEEDEEERTQFIKKRYPETRATYVEQKIKTYGITLVPDLTLDSYHFSFDELAGFGKQIQSIADKDDKFFHTAVHMTSSGRMGLSILTQNGLPIAAGQSSHAELLSLQGPHFGDRHSIISRALTCLTQNQIPVLQTSCTGASIGIILLKGKGEKARNALTDVFEIP